MTTIDWKSQIKGAGEIWAKSFIKQIPKPFYNEGIRDAWAPGINGGTPVWNMKNKEFGDTPITPTEHDPGCGYWPPGYVAPTPPGVPPLVYVSDWKNGRVQVFQLDGTFVRIISGSGLLGPSALTVYNNEVYIADWDGNQIIVFGTDGTYHRKWALSGAEGIYIYNGQVYAVSSGASGSINVFALDGTPIRSWNTLIYWGGQAYSSQGVVVLNNIVYEMGTFCVIKWDLTGTFLTGWGAYGPLGGSYGGIATDGTDIFVVDDFGEVINVYGTGGTLIKTLGNGPYSGIAIWNGEMFVSNYGLQAVQVYNISTGALLYQWGSSGNGDGQFSTPWGIGIG